MRIYIAEDEPLAAAKLKLFLEKLGEGGDIIHYDNGVTAMSALLAQQPDLLFLDIHMPGIDGMEILSRLSTKEGTLAFPVIITSAYDQYALDSFGYDVTDYLLKPFAIERLKQSLQRAKLALKLKEYQRQMDSDTISVRYDGKTEIIPLSDILLIEALKDYVRIIMADKRRLTVLGTISGFEEQLPSDCFMRVHRSFIINTREIVAIEASQIRLTDGTIVPVGKTYRGLFTSKQTNNKT